MRLRPRYDGWTEEEQHRFIESLADAGLVNVAARAVGMTRESAYRLRRPRFGNRSSRAPATILSKGHHAPGNHCACH